MLANFEQLGVRFQYPDNWEMDSHAILAGDREVTVYSPGGAYWTLSIYPRDSEPKQILKDVLAAMKAEYKEVDHEWLHDAVHGHQNEGCEMNFYYLDLTSTAIARVFPGMWANYLVFYQAEDREFATLSDVFSAMILSFLRESNLRQTERMLVDPAADSDADDDEVEEKPRGKAHDRGERSDHVHGPNCNHDHDHGHQHNHGHDHKKR